MIPISTNYQVLLIFSSFDNNYEAKGVFLHISKAFDKMRHMKLFVNLNVTDSQGFLSKFLTDLL